MDASMIEMFLAIAKAGSLSRAAEKLYLSQSTLSNRLSALEAEVGASLIIRAQGKKHITLTPKGEEFILFAQRYSSLMKDINAWKEDEPRYNLKIASPVSLNVYVLPPLFTRLIDSNHPLTLTITSHWNHIIYSMMETYDLDIGLVTRLFRSPHIVTKPVFSERLVMISHGEHSDYPDVLHPSALDVRDEILLDWGPNYELWHDKWWPPGNKMDFIVDTPMLIHSFIARKNAWSIVPLNVAQQLKRLSPIRISDLEDPVPNRIIYQLTPRLPKPGSQRALQIFDEELQAFLHDAPDIADIEDATAIL